jgi:hypothetical protein
LLGADEMLLFDENGMPIEGDPLMDDPNLAPTTEPEPLDDAFIERALGGRRDQRPTSDEEGPRGQPRPF